MRIGRRGVQTTVVVAVGSMSFVLSACGAAHSVAPPPTRAIPATTSIPTTSATLDPASTAVLQAYRASWAAFGHALPDANPEDPELSATMIDPQLQGVKANLLADQRQGIVGRGNSRCIRRPRRCRRRRRRWWTAPTAPPGWFTPIPASRWLR